MRIPEIGASLERLADEIRVEHRDGDECLLIRIAPAGSSPERPALSAAIGVSRGLAQALERPPQDPRDVHLRVADLLGDLRLGQILDEAQPQHLALHVAEHLEAPCEIAARSSTSS